MGFMVCGSWMPVVSPSFPQGTPKQRLVEVQKIPCFQWYPRNVSHNADPKNRFMPWPRRLQMTFYRHYKVQSPRRRFSTAGNNDSLYRYVDHLRIYSFYEYRHLRRDLAVKSEAIIHTLRLSYRNPLVFATNTANCRCCSRSRRKPQSYTMLHPLFHSLLLNNSVQHDR